MGVPFANDASNPERIAEMLIWTSTLREPDPPLPIRPCDAVRDVTGSATRFLLALSAVAQPTHPRVFFRCGISDVLRTEFTSAILTVLSCRCNVMIRSPCSILKVVAESGLLKGAIALVF